MGQCLFTAGLLSVPSSAAAGSLSCMLEVRSQQLLTPTHSPSQGSIQMVPTALSSFLCISDVAKVTTSLIIQTRAIFRKKKEGAVNNYARTTGVKPGLPRVNQDPIYHHQVRNENFLKNNWLISSLFFFSWAASDKGTRMYQ